MGERCSKKMFGGQNMWGGSMCSRAGKVEHNGKWYCTQHSPEAQARRDAKREEEYRRQREADQARWQRKDAARKLAKQHEDAFEGYEGEIAPGMVAALQALIDEMAKSAKDLLEADDWLHAIAQEDDDFLKEIGKLQRDQYSAWNWAQWSGARSRTRKALAKHKEQPEKGDE